MLDIFINLKAENRLKFQHYSAPAHRARTTVELLRRETANLIISK